MRRRVAATTSLLLALLVGLPSCGKTDPVVPESWLHVPVKLEEGAKLRFRIEMEQHLSHGPDSTSTVRSEIELGLHVAERQGGALLVKVTRTGDGEGKDFQFHVLPNHKFDRVRDFQFPSVISTTHGEYGVAKLTRPSLWLHDMLRPFPKSRFEEGETWRVGPVFDGVPFPIPMRLVARVTHLDAERVTIETEGDVAVGVIERGAPELAVWAKKSLRSSSGKAVVDLRDGFVERAEWTLELTNDRDWTFQDGSFPEPDGQQHIVRHVIRVTRL